MKELKKDAIIFLDDAIYQNINANGRYANILDENLHKKMRYFAYQDLDASGVPTGPYRVRMLINVLPMVQPSFF